ncbi:MAG: hypothetical protein ACTHMG_15745 [Sphingomonas sp.]
MHRSTELCCGVLILAALAGCQHHRPAPPPALTFERLPVSGALADAKRAGFTECLEGAGSMRCRRRAVMFAGQGPYQAALDLDDSDGSGGFDQLTLWHDDDQMAVQAAGDALQSHGWTLCMTGEGDRGDYEIYTRRGAPVRVVIDISYWSKRRLRVIPEWNPKKPLCPGDLVGQ